MAHYVITTQPPTTIRQPATDSSELEAGLHTTRSLLDRGCFGTLKMAATDERIEGIQHFDIHITDKNIDVSARTLISHVKKNWAIEKLQQKIFDDGISNKLIGYYVRPGHSKDGFVNRAEERSDIVLVRIYGAKTELFIDRARELRNFQLLQKNGLSPRLYCTFENGYCYAFVEGRVLDSDDFLDAQISERSIKLIARIHAVKIDQKYLHHHKMAPGLADSLRKFYRLLPSKFDNPEQQARYLCIYYNNKVLSLSRVG